MSMLAEEFGRNLEGKISCLILSVPVHGRDWIGGVISQGVFSGATRMKS